MQYFLFTCPPNTAAFLISSVTCTWAPQASDCDPQPSPLSFSLVWTTQTALLFTVVLSVCPYRISQSHNPLFVPTEAPSVCKWTWAMADKERLTRPARSCPATPRHTWIWTCAHSQKHTQNEEKRKNEWERFLSFFSFGIWPPALSVLPAFLCHVTL